MNTSDACVSTRSSKPQILATNCAIRSLRAAEVFTSDEPTVTWNISRCAFSTSMRTMQATWIPQQVSVLALNSVLCIRAPDTVGPPAAYLLLPPEMHHTHPLSPQFCAGIDSTSASPVSSNLNAFSAYRTAVSSADFLGPVELGVK